MKQSLAAMFLIFLLYPTHSVWAQGAATEKPPHGASEKEHGEQPGSPGREMRLEGLPRTMDVWTNPEQGEIVIRGNVAKDEGESRGAHGRAGLSRDGRQGAGGNDKALEASSKEVKP
ncbi:MAG: hypothetical protein V3573_01075 [Desulfovibrionaceae bacterium]